MVELSQTGIEARTGLSRLLRGRDTILFEEIGQVQARDGALQVELIDGSQRHLRTAVAQEVARQVDHLLHPARRLLPPIHSVQQLGSALQRVGLSAPLPSALLELLLLGAARVGATDLHLERRAGLQLRIRVDGFIHDIGHLEPKVAERLLGRLKVIAGLVSYRDDVTQEGRARVELDGAGVSARVTTSPGFSGEQAVIRLHDERKARIELEQLGFGAPVLRQLEAAVQLRRGLVVVTGPPSSGKSTTLFALLRRMHQAHGECRRAISIEDPVEVELPAVAQFQVDPARGNGYASLLTAALRQDADVILVGEMRDRDTAHLALQAALCGHLVLTSLHAGSVAESMIRLRDLGLDLAALGSALRVVVAQRLVRRLCPGCRGRGCAACSETGYRGRFAVGEAATLTEPCLQPLGQGGAHQVEAALERAGMVTLARATASRVSEGLTTDEEIQRVLGVPG